MADAVTLKQLAEAIERAMVIVTPVAGDNTEFDWWTAINPSKCGVIMVETTLGEVTQKYEVDIRPVTNWNILT